MTEFKFHYEPAKIQVENLTPLFALCKQYESVGMAMSSYVGVNSICNFFKDRMTFADLREKLKGSAILDYIDSNLKQAEDAGIKTFANFSCWIQGNNFELSNEPVYQLGAHTHPFRMPYDLNPAYTYTIITSLAVGNEVTECFWAKWIEDLSTTITSDWKLLESKSRAIVDSFYRSEKIAANTMAHWAKLRDQSPGEEVKAMLPKQGEQMTVDFNSKNWLHGIDDIGNNLYLYVLFDDYTL